MKRYTYFAADLYEADGGDYVLYSEAQARIEALEWLVDVQDNDFAIVAMREWGEVSAAGWLEWVEYRR